MKHKWNLENRIPACEAVDHNDRTERTCAACGLVKITVHPGPERAWREWRLKDGRQLIGGNTPHGCVAAAKNIVAQPEEVKAI